MISYAAEYNYSLPNLILNVFILLLCASSQIPFKSHFPATSMSDVF